VSHRWGGWFRFRRGSAAQTYGAPSRRAGRGWPRTGAGRVAAAPHRADVTTSSPRYRKTSNSSTTRSTFTEAGSPPATPINYGRPTSWRIPLSHPLRSGPSGQVEPAQAAGDHRSVIVDGLETACPGCRVRLPVVEAPSPTSSGRSPSSPVHDLLARLLDPLRRPARRPVRQSAADGLSSARRRHLRRATPGQRRSSRYQVG